MYTYVDRANNGRVYYHARAMVLDQRSLLEQKWGGSSRPASDGLEAYMAVGYTQYYARCKFYKVLPLLSTYMYIHWKGSECLGTRCVQIATCM